MLASTRPSTAAATGPRPGVPAWPWRPSDLRPLRFLRLAEAGDAEEGQVAIRVEDHHDGAQLAPAEGDHVRRTLARDHVGVGDDRVGRGREPAAVLDAVAGDALDLDRRGLHPLLDDRGE